MIFCVTGDCLVAQVKTLSVFNSVEKKSGFPISGPLKINCVDADLSNILSKTDSRRTPREPSEII